MSSRKSLPPSEQEAGAKRLRHGEDGQILEAVSGTQQRAGGGGGGAVRRKRHQKSEATQAKALAAKMRNALLPQWLFPQLPQQQQQQPPLEVELLEHFHQRKLQEKDCEIQDKDQQIAAMQEHMERMEQEYRNLLQRKEREIQQKDQEISTLKQQLEEMDVIFPPARMEDGGGGGDAAAAEAFVGGILGLEGQPHWGYWEGV